MTPFILAVAAILIAYGYRVLRAIRNPRNNLPPSLPSLPIIGSLPFLSGVSTLYLCLEEKSKQYGKVFAFYMGSRYTVVLNGYDAIREGLVKNAHEYSGRGQMYFEHKVWQDGGLGLIFRPASETQRKIRNDTMIVLKKLGYGNMTTIESKICEEITHLNEYIRNLGGKNWHPWEKIQNCTLNIMYNILFGNRFQYGDEVGQFLQSTNDEMVRCAGPIFDVFPWLAHFPHIKRKFDSCRKNYAKLLDFYSEKSEECASIDGSEESTFVKEYINTVGNDYDKRELAVIIRDLIIAATETVAGQVNWAMILMANHPDIQKRIQNEIDSILARDRLPSLSDRTNLPYLEATILEIMRNRTSAPLSLTHETIEDSIVGGYQIPSKSTVIVNIWSAHMDPTVWKDPEEFRPERFLDSERNVINKDMVLSFSLGKRSCLGEVLGRQELFLFISSLIQQFHILPPEGCSRVEYGTSYTTTFSPINHLVRLVPRE